MSRQAFNDDVKRICTHLRQYREAKLQQTPKRMASLNSIPEQEIIDLESGRIDKVSVNTFLIYLDKMNAINELIDLTNKQEDVLDEMADFILTLETQGTL